MSAIKAFARQQEWKRIMQEQLAQPRTTTGSNATLTALRRTLKQPAPQIAPAAPVLPAAPSPPAAFWAGLASDYVRGIQRPAPAVEAAPPATPAPEPTPPATSKPREAVFHRDLDGRLLHATAGEQRFNFVRDINGRIERAESTEYVVTFQRDLNGQIVGARKEPK